ncbi:copper resistance protein CopC [Candidatus Berkelbacteria bacterium]|nr:copper resistance protein CopC [Candidatus Berkelbacteria bacterium]
MAQRVFYTILGIVLVGAGIFFLANRRTPNPSSTPERSTPAADLEIQVPSEVKKAAHYESNTPEAGAILPTPPPSVVIDVNFDLATGSTIEILQNGTDYGSGETTIDGNKLALRRAMRQDAPDGVYTVTYRACWPDGSCHDGQFSFGIDRDLLTTLTDSRNTSEVTIHMSQIKFSPIELRISAGTRVTWVNDDAVAHYVNTDAHPAHTHIPTFNSTELKKGGSYSYTFTEPGAYPYHCSAHAGTMTGLIAVES